MKYLLISILLIFLSGCYKECSSFCGPNKIAGASVLGSDCHCACDIFHEGPDCTIFKSQKFFGNYIGVLVTNDSIITQQAFSIVPSVGDSGIMVVNHGFFALSADTASLCVRIRGVDIFLPPGVNGLGYLSPDLKRLTLNYIYQGTYTPIYNCTFVGLRQ